MRFGGAATKTPVNRPTSLNSLSKFAIWRKVLTVSSISDSSTPAGRLPFAVDGFERLRRPVWVFDDQRKRKVYANRAALDLWGADSLAELLERDFSDQSPAVRIRMDALRERILLGETVQDRWTFYPNGAPVAVRTATGAPLG